MILTPEAFLAGQIILIDKPLHWTSFQVVNKVRGIIRKQFKIKKIKVGHAGTLDPLATGLLVICCGKMTKSIDRFQGQSKTYSGVIRLGATTPSYDLETPIDMVFPIHHISQSDIDRCKTQFIGEINQKPPVFSALKQHGKRLYEYAREGQTVEIPTRKVTIQKFELETDQFPDLNFVVKCSKGTYIRSLAHDFGKALKSGAHLTLLRRESIGEFEVQNAHTINTFEKLMTSS